MTLLSITDKLIDGLLALPAQKELREGEFSFTLSEGERTALTLSLAIRAPVRDLPPASSPTPPKAEPGIRTYQTTSYFLRECHRRLFTDNQGKEKQLIISGASFAQDSHWLDILVAVKLKHAHFGGVEADIPDLFRHLADLDVGHGLLLTGVFHNHLWEGRDAVNPSKTDRALQHKLEKEGYSAIQAIFSTDGYIGFFSNHVPFALEVLGTGVEEVETHAHQRVVRLIETTHLLHHGLSTPQSPRGGRL
jgi:hypothetical protein